MKGVAKLLGATAALFVLVAFIPQGDFPGNVAPSSPAFDFCSIHWRNNHLGRHFLQWEPTSDKILINYEGRLYLSDPFGAQVQKLADAYPARGADTYLPDTRSEDRFLNPESAERYKKPRSRTEGLYAELSPDGTRLLYSTCGFDEDPSDYIVLSRLALLDLPEGTLQQIDPEAWYHYYPTSSPSGKVFAHIHGGGKKEDTEIIIRSADPSSGYRVFTTIKGIRPLVAPVQWSPDGNSLAFLTFRRSSEEEWDPKEPFLFYLSDADGENLRLIGEAKSLPAWSPDGKTIAIIGDANDGTGLYKINVNTAEKRKLAQVLETNNVVSMNRRRGNFLEEQPRWSPDGRQILFMNNLTTGEYPAYRRLSVVNADGTEPRIISEQYIETAAWAPDGERIAAITIDKFHNRALVTMAPDGKEIRYLARGVTDHGLISERAFDQMRGHPLSLCANGRTVPDPENNPRLVEDCATLLNLRDTLGGSGMHREQLRLNWVPDRDIHDWEGVTIEGLPKRVTEINLRNHYLQGTLTSYIWELDALRRLDLSDNEIRGNVIIRLTRKLPLEHLDLSENLLNGSLTPYWKGLDNLKILRLNGNALSGYASELTQLGELPRLRELDLSNNRFKGEFGPILANLVGLDFYGGADNELTLGCLPWLPEDEIIPVSDTKITVC